MHFFWVKYNNYGSIFVFSLIIFMKITSQMKILRHVEKLFPIQTSVPLRRKRLKNGLFNTKGKARCSSEEMEVKHHVHLKAGSAITDLEKCLACILPAYQRQSTSG